jgi:hypothetical protein
VTPLPPPRPAVYWNAQPWPPPPPPPPALIVPVIAIATAA